MTSTDERSADSFSTCTTLHSVAWLICEPHSSYFGPLGRVYNCYINCRYDPAQNDVVEYILFITNKTRHGPISYRATLSSYCGEVLEGILRVETKYSENSVGPGATEEGPR